LKQKALNDSLREIFIALEEKGYKKTDIGKLLLGANGYAPLSRFISKEHSNMMFGIKPLSRMAEQAGYSLHMTFVKEGDTSVVDTIDAKNFEFFEELPTLIEKYLNDSYSTDMQKVRNSTSAKAINEMFADIGL